MTHHTGAMGRQGRLLMLAAWLYPALGRSDRSGRSEDARMRRLSRFDETGGHMAEDIECEVCMEAAGRFPKLLEQRPSSEAEVLELVGTFCEGRKRGDSFDNTLEKEGWRVTERDGIHQLEKNPKAPSSRRDVMASFAQRDSMKLACLNTVKEHESEFAHFLWKKSKHGIALNSTEISKRLCHRISRACKNRERRLRRRDRKLKSRVPEL
mmetsp:Transcript_37640/g.82629  ORF Transcript_37640/g.82629 Transcript_37640/m.82629 type:complete len:210 (-) Transcript_37640:100-729(-)